MENKYTEKEHYVPQVLLRGFSPQYDLPDRDKIDKSKYRLYVYDLEKKQQYGPVSVKSQCSEDNLYEFEDSEGKYVFQNLIEKILGAFETKFGEYRRSLENKAFYIENYNTPCFLTTEEKLFWVVFIVIQILRSPEVLREAEKVTQEVFPIEISNLQARNLARYYCLPFWKEIDEDSPEMHFFEKIISPLLSMSFAVCVDNKGRFVTSDKAIYIYSPVFPCDEYERVIFPITSKICLFLLGGEQKENCPGKNILFPATDAVCETVLADISRSAYRMIYSNHELNPKELKLLKDALNSKYCEE